MTAKRRSKRRDEPNGSHPHDWALEEVWPFPSGAEIEARFEELIRGRWSPGGREIPADVFVMGREVWVELELPGVEQESVTVRCEHGELFVEAHRKTRAPTQDARPARLERARGPLRRRVPLPALAGSSRVEFQLEAGVLRVRLVPEERS